MNNKILALIIIGLCSISIIIGLFSKPKISDSQISKEKSSYGFKNVFTSGNKIALISLDGEISSESSSGFIGDMTSAEAVRKSLKRAFDDNSVKGILLRINSPGGTVAMSQEIYGLILNSRNKKPVVVSMLDLAASGGYYISSAADRIYAEPGTLTGSVGVIMNLFDAQKLLNDKLGIKSNVIKSGKFKDIASPYKPLSRDERSLLQNLINNTYQQFLKAIISGRVVRKDNYSIKISALKVATLKKYADGRVFTGEQAQKLGFVDQIGGLYEAQAGINKMAQERFNLPKGELPLVPYNMPSGFGEFLFGASESIFPKKDALSSVVPFSAKHHNQPLLIWE